MIYKTALMLIMTIAVLNASSKEDLIKLYKEKEFRKACTKAGNLYLKYKDDEEFLNIFAHSCLEVDMIDRTILPIIKLHKTPQSRENAAYLATIFYKKKLLYHALIDDVDISYINLPKTEHILSIVFNKFVDGDYIYKNDAYWFDDDKNSELSHKLSVETHRKIKKIFLRTYKEGKIIKVRTYW